MWSGWLTTWTSFIGTYCWTWIPTLADLAQLTLNTRRPLCETTRNILLQIYRYNYIDFNFLTKINFGFLIRISMFGHNLDDSPKFRFLIKIYIFDQNFDFWSGSLFLSKNSIFDLDLDFWAKIRFFWQKFDVCPTFRFLTTNSMFDQNFDLAKHKILKTLDKYFWQCKKKIKIKKQMWVKSVNYSNTVKIYLRF